MKSSDLNENMNENRENTHESANSASKTRVNSECEAESKVKHGEPGMASVSRCYKDPESVSRSASSDVNTVIDLNQPFTSMDQNQIKRSSGEPSEPSTGDLCAAILLTCLFCQPVDCLVAWLRGLGRCTWCLCSSVCGCDPRVLLHPVLDAARFCLVCDCVDRCSPCDAPSVCDLCFQGNECLDLCMEFSQMLYH